MDNSNDTPPKTVPPLRIKNVRSLQALSVSEESDSDSSSDNQHLMIDEVYEVSASDDAGESEVSKNHVTETDGAKATDKSPRHYSNRQSTNSDDSCPAVQNLAGAPETTTANHSKANRRKSHHVPKQVDVVFEEGTILSAVDNVREEHTNDSNKHLMKHIAMLKSCINYALEEQGFRPLAFKQNYEKVSKLMEQYNQMKRNKHET
ncbi:uncharacterized protein LOC128743735 [Sabethes cyaneus]|uniref:uncharacterized protein LOC128743735 n=1 Tax=Sabethes cyaneus TaxID=53552 RepID=UPI00237DE79E|nr:uncharacterized protein LOC128743735 [Sabethes cyaneus]